MATARSNYRQSPAGSAGGYISATNRMSNAASGVIKQAKLQLAQSSSRDHTSHESSLSAKRMKSVLKRKINKNKTAQRHQRPNRAQSLRRAPTRSQISSSSRSIREQSLVNADGDIPPPIPPKSPVLLVRKKSLHSRSRYSNPVRRLFAWLLRHRSLRRRPSSSKDGAYTKDQLTRRLSFDVDFNRSTSHYGVSNKQILTLAPRLEKRRKTAIPGKPDLRSTSQSMFDPIMNNQMTAARAGSNGPPTLHAPRPISAHKLLATPTLLSPEAEARYVSPRIMGTSNIEKKHLKPTLNLPAVSREGSREMKAAPIGHVSAQDGILGPAFEPSRNASIKRNVSRRERDKSSNHLAKQASVKRSATRASKRSAFPVIRRSEIYGSEDPTILLEPSDIRGRHFHQLSAFDDPNTVDDAMNFVKTWSTYLRQAIAVRAKLQNEIRKWEQNEEQEWRDSMMSSDSDSYSEGPWDGEGSLQSSTSHDSLSSAYSEELEIPERAPYHQLYSSSFSRDNAKELDHSQQRASYSPLVLPVIQETRFSDFFRDSLDPKRISSRYSTLITDSQASDDDASSFDSIRSLSKPEREALWMSGAKRSRSIASKRAPGRSVSASTAIPPRPLPEIPVVSTTNAAPAGASVNSRRVHTSPPAIPVAATAELVPGASSSSAESNGIERIQSEKILKEMYTEVDELRRKSLELSELMHSSNSSNYESSSALSAGVLNKGPGKKPSLQSDPSPAALTPIDQTAAVISAVDLVGNDIPSHLETGEHDSHDSGVSKEHITHSPPSSSSSPLSDGDLRRGGAIRKRGQRKPSTRQQHAVHARNMSIDSAWKSTDSDSSSFTSFTNVGLAIIA